MKIKFASELNKMIDAGIGLAVEAPATNVAVGRRVEYTKIGPAPLLTFETNDAIPLRELTVAMEPIQDLHGYNSPWPAGGGKNLLPNEITTTTAAGVTYVTQENGSVIANGTATQWANATLVSDLLLKAGTYILSGTTVAGAYITLLVLPDSGETYSAIGVNGTKKITFTNDVHVLVRLSAREGTVLSNAIYQPMIRLVTETDPVFEPYSNICPIIGRDTVRIWHESAHDTSAAPAAVLSLGDTVYGALLDVSTGELIITDVLIRYDGSVDEAWERGDYAGGARYSLSPDPLSSGEANEIIFNYLETLQTFEAVKIYGGILQPDGSIDTFWPGDIASVQELREYLAANPLEVCYQLATPVIVQLTPQQITAFIGNNFIWSDAGDVSASYGVVKYTEGY